MAAAAAKKVIIAKLINGAPSELRPALEQLCADDATVKALKSAFEASDKSAFTPEQIAQLKLPEESQQSLLTSPELINYLNSFFASLK